MEDFQLEAFTFGSVSFAYPKSEYNALCDISFSVNKGEFVLVMGASAAGKSTLLSLLKREIAPAGSLSGEIKVASSVGYLCQNAEESLVCDRVRSELAFGVENLGKTREEIELLVAETAAYFNLENKLESECSSLSGGEKQLVCLASVMMMKPDILVLDEPCSMLDPLSSERFINMIKKLHEELGITVILSEHSAPQLYSYADKIVFLENGRLAFEGTPAKTLDFLERTENPMLSAVPFAFRFKNKELAVKSKEPEEIAGVTALEAKHIYYAYSKENDVLSDLDFKAYKGSINAVIGCNGCGKTTLMKVLSGVYKPYRGKIKANGRVSMLTQSVKDLFTKEKCADEVTFGELTDYLEINDIKERHPYDLSGGQAQRLALAKVLERKADIIILDEPTRGFDSPLKAKLTALLKKLCSEGKTVIIVTHDLDFAGECADFVSFMSEGRIAASGTKKRLFSTLAFYTTSLARLTKGKAVSTEDLLNE